MDSAKSGIEAIRVKTGPTGIPDDLDTDFNLLRWWRGLKGNMELIIPRLQSYIANRKAAQFDAKDFKIKCPQLPYLKKFSAYLPMSKFSEHVVNSLDNSIVVRIRLKAVDYPQLVNVIRTSEFVMAYFAFCEYLLQTVLAQEQSSGQPSGIICLFDLSKLNFREYLTAKNSSDLSKIRKLVINFMQDNYCGLLKNLIFVNVPPNFEIFWQTANQPLADETHTKISIVKDQGKLRETLHPNAIPVSFGGTVPLKQQSMKTDPRVKPITPSDYFTPEVIWKEAGAKNSPQYLRKTQNVPPRETFKCSLMVNEPGEKLVWQFTTELEVEFMLYRKTSDGQVILLLPKICIVTTALPEEGVYICGESGEHIFEFINVGSKVFPMKLEYAVDIVKKGIPEDSLCYMLSDVPEKVANQAVDKNDHNIMPRVTSHGQRLHRKDIHDYDTKIVRSRTV